QVRRSPVDPGLLQAVVNGQTQFSRALSGVNRIEVNSGRGDDTVTLDQSSGTLAVANGILISASPNGLVERDTLTIDNRAGVNATTGQLTSTSVVGLTPGAGVTYSSVEVLNVLLGGSTDTFSVLSTAAGAITTVNGGGGGDLLSVA